MSYNPSNTFSDARLTLACHLTEYPPANNGEYPSDISEVLRPRVLRKYLYGNKHNSPFRFENTLSENCSLLGTDNSADKYHYMHSRI